MGAFFLFDAAFCAVSGEYVLMCTFRTVGYCATAVHLSFGVGSQSLKPSQAYRAYLCNSLSNKKVAVLWLVLIYCERKVLLVGWRLLAGTGLV